MFIGPFVIGETNVLIIVEKSDLEFLTFFVKAMLVLKGLLIQVSFTGRSFIGIIGFHPSYV